MPGYAEQPAFAAGAGRAKGRAGAGITAITAVADQHGVAALTAFAAS